MLRAQDLPNVILINVDDWGWMDRSSKNPQWFQTPNITQFEKESVVFENAYAGAANCAPSRACMLSGMNTPRHGIYTVSPSARGDARTRKIVPIPNIKHLKDSVVLLPELFKKRGYVTANIGKWHVGPDPSTQGIDHNVAGGKNGNPGKGGYFSPYQVPNITDGPDGEYLTDRLTTEAIDFMESNQDTTFFLYLPYYAVHTPLLPKPEVYEETYLNKTGYLHHRQKKYAAMVQTLDDNIGRILNALDRINLADNTMVILTSDNGGIAAISPQSPARAGKGSYFQGGLKVPLMIRWPMVTSPCIVSVPTVNLDFFPTFCELLQVRVDQVHDGESILSVIRTGSGNTRLTERSLYWHFPIYLQSYDRELDQARDPLFRTRPGSLIVKGEWSFHEYFEDNEHILYNLKEDRGELENVAKNHPDIMEELRSELSIWRKKMAAPVPGQSNPEYDPGYSERLLSDKTN